LTERGLPDRVERGIPYGISPGAPEADTFANTRAALGDARAACDRAISATAVAVALYRGDHRVGRGRLVSMEVRIGDTGSIRFGVAPVALVIP
jgi:hypothetical protein